ncbi:MAG: DUF4179 domain-containing protein [Clostridia bacterium]|nr:DUF4179 domain-containing protein [Clostridia bacterium]
MINQNNNLDDIDKMLFSYFDNNKDIPSSTQDTILKAFEKPTKTISLVYKIQKVAIILITFIILTTGVVFAKDIINFITSLFTNTTEGINKAIENGYVQNIDMDFVYDNDIGIKVDYLVMDDTNLDVSFVYDYSGKEKAKKIDICEYIIRDEKNNLIYYYFEDNNDMNNGQRLATHHTRTNDTHKFRESILYTSNEFPNSKNLIFEIFSININASPITGNWIFTINLEEKILKKSNSIYNLSYSPFIEKYHINLNETSFNLELYLNTELNNDILLEPNNIILTDCNGKKYNFNSLTSGNYSEATSLYKSKILLEYNQLSNFTDTDNKFNLYLRISENKIISTTIFK